MRAAELVRAVVDALRNLGAWAEDYRYLAGELARGGWSWLRREDPAAWRTVPGRETAGIPVLLLPGIYETWRMMRPVAQALRAAGHPVHVVRRVRLNSMSVAVQTGRVVRHLRDTPELAGEFAIVAHSKGGLVGKSVLLVPGVGERVRVLVTIATPFSGSSLASLWVPGLGIRSLSPRAAAIRTLRAQVSANERIVALIPSWDPHIPDASAVEGGTNIRLRARGHFAPLGSPEVHRLVLGAVSRAQGRG